MGIAITGLEHPKFATLAGTVWVLARYVLHRGYNSTDVKYRTIGGLPATLSLMSFWVGSTVTLVQLLAKIHFKW